MGLKGLIQAPHYHGQFALSLRKKDPDIFNPINTDILYSPLSVLINGLRLLVKSSNVFFFLIMSPVSYWLVMYHIGLVAKMELHMREQTRQVDQERWRLTQEESRLKALQAALEDERRITLEQLSAQRAEVKRDENYNMIV